MIFFIKNRQNIRALLTSARKAPITSQQLDAQSPVKIDRFVEFYGEDARAVDSDRDLTKFMLGILLEGGSVCLDDLGRIWGKGGTDKTKFYPFHIEHDWNVGRRPKLVGFRFSQKASN